VAGGRVGRGGEGGGGDALVGNDPLVQRITVDGYLVAHGGADRVPGDGRLGIRGNIRWPCQHRSRRGATDNSDVEWGAPGATVAGHVEATDPDLVTAGGPALCSRVGGGGGGVVGHDPLVGADAEDRHLVTGGVGNRSPGDGHWLSRDGAGWPGDAWRCRHRQAHCEVTHGAPAADLVVAVEGTDVGPVTA